MLCFKNIYKLDLNLIPYIFAKVCVTARKDVPNFGPPISNDCIYENDDTFKDWLLNKLINAEYSCYKADKFKKLKVKFI